MTDDRTDSGVTLKIMASNRIVSVPEDSAAPSKREVYLSYLTHSKKSVGICSETCVDISYRAYVKNRNHLHLRAGKLEKKIVF
jgi:hypothetical protein